MLLKRNSAVMEELYIAANHATNVAYFPHDLECH